MLSEAFVAFFAILSITDFFSLQVIVKLAVYSGSLVTQPPFDQKWWYWKDVYLKQAKKIKSSNDVLPTQQWQSALLVVGLPVTHDWFEMGCHLSPRLISIRLTA